MPAPILRQFTSPSMVASTWTAISPACPAGRAYVLSKVVVSNAGTSAAQFYLSAGAPGTNGHQFAMAVTINAGEVYTESGIVIVAGNALNYWTNVAGFQTICTAFAEEVDNV